MTSHETVDRDPARLVGTPHHHGPDRRGAAVESWQPRCYASGLEGSMKKLILVSVLSAFSFTAAAAHACDGMKGHDKSAETKTQAKKEKKADTTKSEQKS
jgi:ribosomal protein L12E/L44/L45/RPP1/RPP2